MSGKKSKEKNRETVLQKNEIYEAEIIDYTTDGSGICRIKGMAVFVPSAAVGDKAEIRILKTDKNIAYGKIERVIVPSEVSFRIVRYLKNAAAVPSDILTILPNCFSSKKE